MKWQNQDETYLHDLVSATGIDLTENHFQGLIVVTEHGHDTMPITLYSRVAWKCDDALFKIAHPTDWVGYNNCQDEEENDRLLRHLFETFEGLGLKPVFKRRAS
ncbi:MAG: hypothetical protein DI537_37915 [Stutzerimonas stutzeri]|nr:MAG: hypothetical protein DI537_37915 [Stutzerimonas stutzeri]